MTRPAWLDVVAEICGSDVEDWRPAGAHGVTWRWRDEDSTTRTWTADSESVWYEGGGLWVEVRCYGEPDHARLARAVRAGLAVARGDLDVDALQQQVATLTRERDELAARLAEPAGPLVPDAVGWWWRQCTGGALPALVSEFPGGLRWAFPARGHLHDLVWHSVEGDGLWRGPITPPTRGAR